MRISIPASIGPTRLAYFVDMTTSQTEPWAGCQVCGHTNHGYRAHLDEVAVPDFVHASVGRLRELERTGVGVHPLVAETSHLVEVEDGGRKAWAIWLLKLLEELEDAKDTPDIAAEIENYLLGGYST